MGYMHINNLYKDQAILMFKRCFALEKIHGTSAHVEYQNSNLKFFSGGMSHVTFRALFNEEPLLNKFKEIFGFPIPHVVVFGEAYGGKEQGMSATYGKEAKFVAFDVRVGDVWLSVPQAHDVCNKLGIEFVHYKEVSTDVAELDAERDADSEQAIRNGVGPGKRREGVVLRPLIEVTLNNGSRVMAKHKRDEFRETASPRVVDDPSKLAVLAEASKIADEWVTAMRLNHVLQKIDGHCMEKMPDIIRAMQEDVTREAGAEIVISRPALQAIGKKTAQLYKAQLQNSLK